MLDSNNAKLILTLERLIKKYGSNDKVRKIIMDEFRDRNMKASVAVNILNERLELSTLNIDDSNKDLIVLFVFTTGMYKALSHKESEEKEPVGDISEILDIDPKNYFTDKELAEFTDFKFEKKEDSKNHYYVFSDMIEVSKGVWKGVISAKFLTELDYANDIVYNFKTQRDPVIDVYGIKRIRIDKTKVKTIKERLIKGQQYSDDIKINLLKDGNDRIEYDRKSRELTYYSGTLNIFDGYHRKTAVVDAVKVNPNLDFNFGLTLTNFTEQQATEFLIQIDKQKPIKQEHIKSLDLNNDENLVVDFIKDTKTEFAKNIKDSDDEIKYGGGFTKRSIVAKAIEENYKGKLESRIDARPIADHIADVMDYIISLYKNDFLVDPDTSKKTSYVTNKNMFAGYVVLSEMVYNDPDWKVKVKQALNKVDFNISNPMWLDNGLVGKDLRRDFKKPTRNNLYKYFRGLI